MTSRRRLDALGRVIRAEQNRPQPDEGRLRLLKRLRLNFKDALPSSKASSAPPRRPVPPATGLLEDPGVIQGLAAACALIAQADGSITPTERGVMLERIGEIFGARLIDLDRFLLAFESAEEAFSRDGRSAHREAEAQVAQLASTPAAAVVAATAANLALADGVIDPEEHHAIRRIFALAGLGAEAAEKALFEA